MAADNAPPKGLEKEVKNPTDAGDKSAVSIASVDDASIKSFSEKTATDNAAAAKSVEKDFGTLAFDYGSGTENPDAKAGETPTDGEKEQPKAGETPADGEKEQPKAGETKPDAEKDQPKDSESKPDAEGDKAPPKQGDAQTDGDNKPAATEGEQTPEQAGTAVGENIAEQSYDWATDMYSRFALGEGRARQASELPGSWEIQDTEDGRNDALILAEEDLQNLGDKFAHVLDPTISKELLKDLGDDTHNVSGNWADKDAGIAYLKIDSFMGSDTAEDVAKLLDDGFKGAKGIILDLRGNPGGQVDEGLQTAALFLSSGKMMSNQERVPNLTSDDFDYKERTNTFNLTADSIETPALPTDDSHPDGKVVTPRGEFADRTDGTPLTILVDEHTASSAEILLAALRQNQEANAKTVGEQTGGKGIGQAVLINPENGSASTVTSTKFFRPDGTWAGDYYDHKYGMLPDVTITSNITDLGTDDIQYNFAVADMRNRIGQ